MTLGVSLRRVRYDDCVAFYCWWTDRESRRFGSSVGRLRWQNHLRWFAENIKNPLWFVGEIEDTYEHSFGIRRRSGDYRAIGALRVDSDAVGGGKWISIVLAPEERGKGYGTEMLRRLLLDQEHRVLPLHARIHRFNLPSQRAFEKAGFCRCRRDDGVWQYWVCEGLTTAGADR